jgi:nifR3 family TIM-barrel protein
MKSFWQKLNKPFFALAPMANVTDAAFRSLIAKYGRPDVFWTEFVSADGLASAGQAKLLIDLKYSKKERPIVAQLFSANPEKMKKAAALCATLGFDGIDINMGCPDRTIEKQGAGAAAMKNPALAREIIRAARAGAPDLPISVKTRIGYNKNEMETWLPEILKEGLAALTVHLRTRKEMSDVPAHWDLMKRIIEIRDEFAPETLIIGNGDAIDLADAKKKAKETGCDGVMLGRAIFGNPWLFSKHIPSVEEKLKVMVEHTKLFDKHFKGIKNFATMRKHYKAYCSGFDGAKELRIKLMETDNSKEVAGIVRDFLKK